MLRFACNDWAPAFAGELLFPLPHFLSGHPGFKHLRSGEGLRIDFAGIAVDNDEISPFAFIEAADPSFRESRIGGTVGEAGQRLFETYSLL